MGTPLGLPDTATARAELAGLGAWNGTPAPAPAHLPHPVTRPGPGTAVLAGWRMLLDAGRMQDGEPNLAGTAHPAVLRLSPASAADIGAENGEAVTVSTEHGALTLPLVITDMPDRVVWVPMNAPGHSVHTALATHPGGVVELRRAGLTMEVEGHE